jgi:hypothetical protein
MHRCMHTHARMHCAPSESVTLGPLYQSTHSLCRNWKSDLPRRNHRAIVQPRLYDCSMVTAVVRMLDGYVRCTIARCQSPWVRKSRVNSSEDAVQDGKSPHPWAAFRHRQACEGQAHRNLATNPIPGGFLALRESIDHDRSDYPRRHGWCGRHGAAARGAHCRAFARATVALGSGCQPRGGTALGYGASLRGCQPRAWSPPPPTTTTPAAARPTRACAHDRARTVRSYAPGGVIAAVTVTRRRSRGVRALRVLPMYIVPYPGSRPPPTDSRAVCSGHQARLSLRLLGTTEGGRHTPG